MSIPEPTEDQRLRELFAGNPVIDTAEAAIRSFGTDLTRATARRLLQSWKYTPELTVRERQAVLARFPETLDRDATEDYPHREPLGYGNSGPGGDL